jgi:hypothetical protein
MVINALNANVKVFMADLKIRWRLTGAKSLMGKSTCAMP